MTDPTQYLDVADFTLSSGRKLLARIAYVTLGTLNEARNNAVLVTHGFTSSHRFILPGSSAAEGSWSELVGPGRAIDTDRYFVICSNALGSSYGTTGPRDTDQETGKPFGADFPAISFADIASLQHTLLQAMGVIRLHAVVGVSMGGFQAWQWAIQYPHAVEGVGVVLATFSPSRVASALQETLAADPSWNGGHPASGAMLPMMTRMRLATLKRYGMESWLAARGLTPGEIEKELLAQCESWAREFDPCSLLVLRRAMDDFDARPSLSGIHASVLLVLSTTDVFFPASAGPGMLDDLRGNNVRAVFQPIESIYGHLASGLDWQRWSDALKKFIETAPPSTARH